MGLISYIGHIMCTKTGDLRWRPLARWHHTDEGPQCLEEPVPLVGRERAPWRGQRLWHNFSPSPVKRSSSSPVEHREMIAGNEKILSQRVKWNSDMFPNKRLLLAERLFSVLILSSSQNQSWRQKCYAQDSPKRKPKVACSNIWAFFSTYHHERQEAGCKCPVFIAEQCIL